MLLPDGTYEEWISFERRGPPGRWHRVVWESRAKSEAVVADIMLNDPTICCLHHSPTEPAGERPESAFGKPCEAAR